MKVVPAEKARLFLRDYFGRLPAGQPICGDPVYAVPTKRWLLKVFAPYFAAYKRARGMDGYITNARDCENFANAFVMEAQAAHAAYKAPGKPSQSCGLAVGRMFYHSSIGVERGYHAAVVALVWDADQGGLTILTIEPQTEWETHLTTTERRSCNFCEI